MSIIPSIIVHGGSGQWPDHHPEALAGVRAAASLGWELLSAGRCALDVVELAARALEDDPVFDAGRGSYVNTVGQVEMDAIIMDGAALKTGAVAAIRSVANPISVARLVMERTPHNLLVGEGAAAFARQMSVPLVPDEYLVVGEELEKLQAIRRGDLQQVSAAPGKGTIGVVARDANGNIAAGTSTGGTKNKLPGRVGDSPLIGCGVYADNALGGASATGLGEAIMKVVMSKMVCDLMGAGMDAPAATAKAVSHLDEPRIQGWGGVIAVDPQGRIGFSYNAKHLVRAYSTPDGSIVTEI